ncbi:MAG: vWA domain-containing protein [Planctomycetota bacterium]|jgi:hypothetical protein
MVNPTDPPSELAVLLSKLEALQETVRRIQEQREQAARRRRRNLLILGVSVSMVLHVVLLLYLGSIYRRLPGGPVVQGVSYEFAILQEEELTELEQIDIDEALPEVSWDSDEQPLEDPAAELDALAPEADLVGAGELPALGGSGVGEGGEPGLGGGGAGTSFFGISSRGTRFAYIVDRSTSMLKERKLGAAMRQLSRSIESLPDYAYFYVVLFSSDITLPPMQHGWTRARPNIVSHLILWLNQVEARGATMPARAFLQVFSLDARPDVVFFLTDGEISNFTAADVAALNSRGKRAVINTIAFGDPASQDLLREIADQSGGVYRYVPSEGE